MEPRRTTITTRLEADPDDVFELITDVARLPEGNERIHHVVEAPDAELAPGVEWVVEVRAMGIRRDSRSTVLELDRAARRFVHRSRTDDGNPSDALWTWQVTPTEQGSQISVTWELHPRTFWRKQLFVRIRHHQLHREVRASLAALGPRLATTGRTVPT